jgi:hypothetical protein
MMMRNPNARSKELRSAERRAKKEQKIAARRAARQPRDSRGMGPPAVPKSGR